MESVRTSEDVDARVIARAQQGPEAIPLAPIGIKGDCFVVGFASSSQ